MDTLWRVGRLATLYQRILGLHGLRMDVGIELPLGLGAVSLWQMDLPLAPWLGLETRQCVGTGVGGVAA